jgi:hypothetical protein
MFGCCVENQKAKEQMKAANTDRIHIIAKTEKGKKAIY